MDNESESSKHARVHCLWSSLDSEGNGHIDLAELKAGLKRLDHRKHSKSITLVCLLTIYQL